MDKWLELNIEKMGWYAIVGGTVSFLVWHLWASTALDWQSLTYKIFAWNENSAIYAELIHAFIPFAFLMNVVAGVAILAYIYMGKHWTKSISLRMHISAVIFIWCFYTFTIIGMMPEEFSGLGLGFTICFSMFMLAIGARAFYREKQGYVGYSGGKKGEIPDWARK